MKADFVRILIPNGNKPVLNGVSGAKSAENYEKLESARLVVSPPRIKGRGNGPSWSGYLAVAILLIMSAFILRHEFQISDLQQGYEDRIIALEAKLNAVLDTINGEMVTDAEIKSGSETTRLKREANYQSSTSYRSEQIRNGRGGGGGNSGGGGSEGGSYFGGEDDSFLGRVTLPPIKGYQFNEERYDGGSANDDDVDLDSASISAETERLSRQQHHSSSSYSRGGGGSSASGGGSQRTSSSTTQHRQHSGSALVNNDIHTNNNGGHGDEDDYESVGEGGRRGSSGSGTGCTTSLCTGGSGLSSSYSGSTSGGGGGTTYQRGSSHRSSSVVTQTQQQSPVRTTTYTQTVYPIRVLNGQSQSGGAAANSGASRQSSSFSSQSQYGSSSSSRGTASGGGRSSGHGQSIDDYSAEDGDELVIGSASGSGGQQPYVPEIARVLTIPNNVFRTGGIDLGLGNTFTHSGNRCGNLTTTRNRSGSITTSGRVGHTGHAHADTEPCPAAAAMSGGGQSGFTSGGTSGQGFTGTSGGTGSGHSYNYTYVREVSQSSSSGAGGGGNTTTIQREYGTRPDNRHMQNWTRTEIIPQEPYHPPVVLHVEPATTQRNRYQTRQQQQSGGSTFYFQGSGSQNTREREIQTNTQQRYNTPASLTTTTTPAPITTVRYQQPYDEWVRTVPPAQEPTATYRIPYVDPYEDQESYEQYQPEPSYPAPTYAQPTYAAPTYVYPAPTYVAQTVSSSQSRQITYKSSTCRGQQRPLAAHYVGDGNGMLRSADGIFKEWKSAEWMTAQLYREDGHYASTSTNFIFSATTGTLTVKKAGLYFIYSQVHTKEGDDGMKGFIIEINSGPFLQCSLSKTNSCYTAGLRFLEENDEILIKALELSRVSSYSVDKTFFGLMSVGSACS